KGLPIYAETLHHYACFTAEDYKTPRGFCYHTYPSLKYPEDQTALWDGLVHDGVSTTATDEFPTSLELKLRGQDLENVTGGNLGAEARMGIVFSEGVMKRRMSLQRFADVTATNAARILGLYPQKGVIAPGSDADLVLIDPAIRKTLAPDGPLPGASAAVVDMTPRTEHSRADASGTGVGFKSAMPSGAG